MMLTKTGIHSAFCLYPVHLEDCYLLTMHWKEEVYIDHSIPFGLQLAPELFDIVANLLSWAA